MPMASIDVPNQKIRGVRGASKLATRIDMTPMVDLGFLLITFFIFTATMSKPTTMDLNMPKDIGVDTPVKQSGSLTILLERDKVYYYEGELANNGSNITLATFKSIRSVIINKKGDVIKNHKHDGSCEKLRQTARRMGDTDWEKSDVDRDLVVIIKPSAEATYKNTIDILDEMTINRIKRFAIVKISDADISLINKRKRL